MEESNGIVSWKEKLVSGIANWVIRVRVRVIKARIRVIRVRVSKYEAELAVFQSQDAYSQLGYFEKRKELATPNQWLTYL